ncbi:MAG: response regulator [Hungatella sp.]|jgi:YesN/AraC family two-component response regulator|nr:response regulator [Hungatella sp.]
MFSVLIVDDEKMIREGIRRTIGWPALNVEKVCTAASALEALALFETINFDLLITDINMSEVSGLVLIRQIKESRPKLRVIVLTGYEKFEYARTALKLNVNEFLLKPVDEDELACAVREQLDCLEDKLDLFYDVFREFKNAMIEQMNHLDKVLHLLDRLRDALDNYHLPEEEAVRCLYDIASVVTFAYIKESGEDRKENLLKFLDLLTNTAKQEAFEITKMYLTTLLNAEAVKNTEIIYGVKRYIKANLVLPLSVAQIAEQLHISSNYLTKLFKKETGIGCNEYITRKRIEKACNLLKTTSLPTGIIGEKVGYTDVNYFSAAFKRQMGVSPRKYRALDLYI